MSYFFIFFHRRDRERERERDRERERERERERDRERERERSFESSVTVGNSSGRFARYETPPRARTSSYSGRSGSGTPGASPAHPGVMSRSSRRAYQSSAVAASDPYYGEPPDYPDPSSLPPLSSSRRFRSYDDFPSSVHDDYEPSIPTSEPVLSKLLVDDDLPPTPGSGGLHLTSSSRRHVHESSHHSLLPPPAGGDLRDIRHLHEKRDHLLVQLQEECHSGSGDDLFAPSKKRKLIDPMLLGSGGGPLDDDEPEIASLLVTSHTGRKGMEVRRVSDSKVLLHNHSSSRRSSCEQARSLIPCKRRRDNTTSR